MDDKIDISKINKETISIALDIKKRLILKDITLKNPTNISLISAKYLGMKSADARPIIQEALRIQSSSSHKK